MLARNSAGPAVANATNGAREIDQLGGEVGFLATPDKKRPQPLRAELIGSNACKAIGITAIDSAPALAICRKLLAAGVDRDRPLVAYRGTTLALRVRSVGEGARLRVRGKGFGFEITAPETCPAAPPVRQSAI